MRFLALLAFLLAPATLWASCGTDLRPTLSASQSEEIAQRLKDVPYPSGNHWIATRGTRVIHVIGTMHTDDPRMDPLAARLAPLFNDADMFLVEATAEDEMQMQRDLANNPELAFLSGKTLIELLPPSDWEKLAEAAAARGIPSFMAAKFKPWYLSLLLSMSPCTLKEISAGGEGLDARLITLAEAKDIPVRALESYMTLLKVLEQDPLEEQLAMLSVSILPDQVSEDLNTTLEEMYFEEVTFEALETTRVLSRAAIEMEHDTFNALFDTFLQRVLDQRNKAWMPVIAAAKGDKIVVAAGALHLGGENGVLNLLAQDGYTLQRQPF